MSKKYIQTVLGKIGIHELGHIQPHEHLMIEYGNAAENNPALCIDQTSLSIEEVRTYHQNGGKVIVDAQPVGAGRMAKELEEISRKTDVDIIGSTGFHKSVFYWPDHWIHECSSSVLYEIFLEEIQHGMYKGNQSQLSNMQIEAKAGLIKTAVDKEGLTKYYRPKFEAAAAAAKDSGVSIMVHIEKGSDPFKIIEFITGKGVDSSNILLCHLDRTHYDFKLHKEIAQAGVYLEYDTIGRFKYHNDEIECDLVEYMIDQGHTDCLLMSLDTTRERLLSYGGNIGLGYLLQVFIPKLRERGIQEEEISQITSINAQKALSI